MRSSRIFWMKRPRSSTSSWLRPAGRLVEQQQLGLRDERAGELDALQRPEREGPRRAAARSLRARRSRAPRAPRRRRRGSRVCAPTSTLSSTVIVLNSSTFWNVRAIPRRDDPVHGRLQQRLAGELDLALVRRVEPGDHVERGRLAGAVRPDQADDLAVQHVERDPVEGDDPAEPASDIPQREQGHRPRLAYAGRIPNGKGTARPPERRLLCSAVSDLAAETHMSRGQKITNLLGVAIPFVGFLASVFFLWGRYVTWRDLIIFAVGYALTTLGISIGFHRLFTHRSYETYKAIRYGLAVLGSMAVQGPVIRWVSDHRKHHSFADREGDPHSPHAGFAPRHPREDRRPLARARRLALPQRRPCRVDEVCEGPARGPRHGLHLADVRSLGRALAAAAVRGRLDLGRHASAPGCRRCSGAA